MTELPVGALPGVDRPALRARLAAAAPDGLIWLDSVDLPHPEAVRATRLPLAVAIGRIADGTRRRTVREAEMVLAALVPDEDDQAALADYARFVVATAPTMHARLTGRTLAAWLAARAAA